MIEVNVTPDLLVVIVAGVLAFVFDYFPWLKEKYDQLQEYQKKQLMFVLIFVESTVIFAGGCLGWFAIALTCDVQGVLGMFSIFLVAIGVNQGVHTLTKPTKANA